MKLRAPTSIWAKLIISLATVFVVLGAFAFGQGFEVRQYQLTSPKLPPGSTITLVQISDLHSNRYGARQQRVIEALSQANPDAVLLTGDILDHILSVNNAVALVEEVSARWPTFFIFGNHEFMRGDAGDFLHVLKANGVTVLRGNAVEFSANGATIQIGGVDDPLVSNLNPERAAFPELPTYRAQVQQLSTEIDNSLYTVIMNHRPERVYDLLHFQPDLVLSGHAHGGQWHIPGILDQGVFAPGQGVFPAMTNGLFEFGSTNLIVSRGLTRYAPPVPRFFNRPDLVVINITAE